MKGVYVASMHAAAESWKGARHFELVQLRMSTMNDERTLVFCIYIRQNVSSLEPQWAILPL